MIQNFTFTGNINLNFFTFKDSRDFKILNATFAINKDVYGYIFNGLADSSKALATKFALEFNQISVRTLSNSEGVTTFNGGIFHIRQHYNNVKI